MSTPINQARTIFLETIEMDSPENQAKFLERACQGNAELRARVERLLQSNKLLGSFHDEPGPPAATVDLTVAERPGTVVGQYKLVQQIGEGGFGVVFLAEQERPVKRRVALKIIKPGMDTRQVIARFEAERQALAMMDHPNIAKVLDAGTTGAWSTNEVLLPAPSSSLLAPTGRPYFVMELVQGVPITEYCDQCNLSTRQRLELFVTVCQAVQHAHQKGIIHRDIKPTNVLVAIQDGLPSPKIIDFGVAKAIGQQLTEHTLTNAFAQMVGTPLYMSPEQAELSALGVDTRSDIYSLGVLLYELLTGSTPFDKDRLHAASYDELRRIIREEEPPRPSARITTFAADKASTVAERRRTDTRRLGQQVRGELDWIVMKCLEKDRNRRYETPNSLARDIERFLSDEPVQACPPTARYRFRKFAMRNKAILGAGGAIAAALVVGLGLATWQYIRATAERARANAVSDMMKEIMAPSNREPLKRSDNAVRELVQDFSAGLGDQLAGEPEVEHVIRTIIDQANWRLGVYGRAEPIPETEYAVSYCWLANYLAAHNRQDEAKALLRKATDHLGHAVRRGLAPAYHVNALFYLAIVRLRLGDNAGHRDTCAAMLRVPVDNSDDSVPYQRVVIWGLGPHPGEDLSARIKEAEELVAESSEFDHPSVDLGVLGGLLYRAGQYEHSEQRLNEAIAAHKIDPLRALRTTIDWQLLLAMTNWKQGQREEARRQLAEIQPALDEWLRSPSSFWIRRVQIEILRQEAEGLIEQDDAVEAVENKTRTSDEPNQ